MNIRLIRILFIIILPLLSLQYYIAMEYSEPYPAIIYPSFEGVSNNSQYNKYINTEITVNFENGELVYLDERSFFGEIPYKFRKILLKNYFLNTNNENKIENHEYKEFTIFIKTKLEALGTTGKPESITIKWFINNQYYRENPIRTQKLLLQSGTINFN